MVLRRGLLALYSNSCRLFKTAQIGFFYDRISSWVTLSLRRQPSNTAGRQAGVIFKRKGADGAGRDSRTCARQFRRPCGLIQRSTRVGVVITAGSGRSLRTWGRTWGRPRRFPNPNTAGKPRIVIVLLPA